MTRRAALATAAALAAPPLARHAAAFTPPPGERPLFGARVWALPNGMRVAFAPSRRVPVVMQYLFYGAGGGEDPQGISGVAHYMATDETDAIEYVQALLSYLPSNNLDEPPAAGDPAGGADLEITDTDRELDTFVPDSANQPYDMHQVIEHVLDDGEFLEVQPLFAPNIVVGFGRVVGRTVGFIANNPSVMSGVLDIDSSDKASTFIRFCNAFNIPIVNLVDVPGFLPGVAQERGGIIRHGAKMLFAYSAATVPKITIVMRKAYGGSYLAMCSKDLGADKVFAWPSAEIAVMGAEGAAAVVFRREIAAAEEEIGRMIDEANTDVNLASVHGVIGVAGSITTVTAQALKLPEYQSERIHGTSLTVDEIDTATTSLLHLSRSERAALPYMHPGRVDVIGAGALIWRTIVRRVADATEGRVQSAVASEHDILDGIALSAVSRREHG